MSTIIDQDALIKKRAHKRYLKEFADVRVGKKKVIDCSILLDESIKALRLERKNLADPTSADESDS